MKPELFREDSPLVRRVVAIVTGDHSLTDDERVLWLYLFDHRDSNIPRDGYLPVSGVRLLPMITEQRAREAMNGLIKKNRVVEVRAASFTAADGVYKLKSISALE